jgi:DNA helicase-2/ATP-dependent DNA helicase PcrA
MSLRGAGVNNAALFGSNGDVTPKIVVAPIYMVRGIEFDAVIVANASMVNYVESSLSNRLLYLAVSRAAHQLYVHWFGRLAAVLDSAGVRQRTRKRTTTRSKATQKRANRRHVTDKAT